MKKNLVIVESPAKAKTIEKFLGDDFKVMSSFGHIRDLRKKDYGIDLDSLQPVYEIPADKAKVVADLRAQAKKSEAVWLASDEDREGEAIAWHLAEVLGIDPEKARRIVFHEITKPAILAAIEHPRHIDLGLVDAQQARRVLDRLVGFKLSPVLWHKVRPGLSAGRVQSVAVRLIVEREREIEAFKAAASYRVSAVFTTPEGKELSAELSRRFATKQEAEAFLELCQGATFSIAAVQTRPTKRTPAPPFTTSTLQQEAARKIGLPVARTMRLAQELYEAGLITYMRTDSMNLSSLALAACGPVIEAAYGAGFHKRRTYHTSAKGAQEAHEAIRPTDMSRTSAGTSPQARRLYELIWKRTLACQMADALLEKTTITIAVSGTDATFAAQGEVVKFEGFLKLYRESTDAEGDDAEAAQGLLPAVAEGAALSRVSVTATERFSQQPARYTEASLVHKLEELGIGRPSTYASTVDTIQQRQYVAKGENAGRERSYNVLTLTPANAIADETRTERTGAEKGKLLPTDVGTIVNDFLLEGFPQIMDYGFTATVEKDFDAIAEGQKEWTGLIRTFYDGFEPQVDAAENLEGRVGMRQLGTDPKTGRLVSVRLGRYGAMVQIGTATDEEKPLFATLPPSKSIQSVTLDEALELFKLPRDLGEYETKKVVVGVGPFGPYVRHDGKYASLAKGEDPMSVSLDRAIELIEAKREADAKSHLKTFADEGIEVRQGRFGPYVTFEKANYKIPKSLAERAAELSLEECRKIIAEEQARPAKTARRGRAAAKTAAPKKATSAASKAASAKTATTKKAAAKKTAAKKTTSTKTATTARKAAAKK